MKTSDQAHEHETDDYKRTHRLVEPPKETTAALTDLRSRWERGLVQVHSREDQDGRRLLVILKDRDGDYYCHRYFRIGERWEISCDRSNVEPEVVFQWIFQMAGK